MIDAEDDDIVPLGIVHELRVQSGDNLSPTSPGSVLRSSLVDVHDGGIFLLDRRRIITIFQQQLGHRVDDENRRRVVDDWLSKHVEHRHRNFLHVINLKLHMLLKRRHQVAIRGNRVDDNVALSELIGIASDLLGIIDGECFLCVEDLDERHTSKFGNITLHAGCPLDILGGLPIKHHGDIPFNDCSTHRQSQRSLTALRLRNQNVDGATADTDVMILIERDLIIITHRQIAAGSVIEVHVPSRILGHACCDCQRILLILSFDKIVMKCRADHMCKHSFTSIMYWNVYIEIRC